MAGGYVNRGMGTAHGGYGAWLSWNNQSVYSNIYNDMGREYCAGASHATKSRGSWENRIMVALAEIRKLSRRIVEEYGPEKIILFGSYASGKATEDSDIDLLVVMPYKGKAARKACEILNRVKTTLPVDLLVRSPAEVRRRLALKDYFMADIVTQGKTLHETAR